MRSLWRFVAAVVNCVAFMFFVLLLLRFRSLLLLSLLQCCFVCAARIFVGCLLNLSFISLLLWVLTAALLTSLQKCCPAKSCFGQQQLVAGMPCLTHTASTKRPADKKEFYLVCVIFRQKNLFVSVSFLFRIRTHGVCIWTVCTCAYV